MTTARLPRIPRILAATCAWLATSLVAGPQASPAPAAVSGTAPWTLPVRSGMQADLVAAPDGALLLSWVEDGAAAQRLRVARFAGGRWGRASTVASGEMFGNAVDTPRIRQTPDGALWAAWLRHGAAGAHASDVVLSRSSDGGRTWSAPVAVNDDGTATEHGFVSTWVATRDRLGVAWLDGRAKGHGHDDGAQMLRAATFDAQRRRRAEAVVDARTCDCCHTDIAMTAKGALMVYRDRSAAEVRDIEAVRLQGGRWSAPHFVHADGWVMPGCPVNGPAVAAQGLQAAVAWYTGVGGVPQLRLATSRDAGGHFSTPLTLDRGDAVLGRVDVQLRGDRAMAVWLREDATAQSLWFADVPMSRPGATRRVQLATLKGRGRGTGMPRLASSGGATYVVWTDIESGTPVLHGLRVASR